MPAPPTSPPPATRPDDGAGSPEPTLGFGSSELPLVLGIESSCDDTACAVVDGAGRVLASVVSSQLAAHRPFGGVVPEIASREHLRNWPAVSAEALARAGAGFGDVGIVAATRGPGLVGALLVGLSLGKAVAYALGRPFYAVHHLEGHLYSPFLAPPPAPGEPPEPARAPAKRFVGLVVSGGHTTLFAVDAGKVTTLAETRDDAMGEVFDKVGRRLGLPYPQGPVVDLLAEAGDADRPGTPRFAVAACGDGALDFSYSGLKSQTLLGIERLAASGVATDLAAATGPADVAPPVLDLLAAFRRAAVGQVVDRLRRLHRSNPLPFLAVSGGVAANRLLRREVAAWAGEQDVELAAVPLAFAGDNAAMIAHAALLLHRAGHPGDPFDAEAASRIPL